jgi:radical SAM superfamily enzyme YgiQ (UPF0313 family)
MIMMPAWSLETPPMATAYLSTFLRRKNYDVSIFDFNLDFYKSTPHNKRYLFDGNQFNSWFPEGNFRQNILEGLGFEQFADNWAKQIVDRKMDIVCFSTYYSNYLPSLMLAQKIKQLDKSKIIIFGGPESDRYENGYEFIKKDYIDIVVIGEGEFTLERIIEAISKKSELKNIRGILYKERGVLFDNKGVDIEDIDKIPFPTFDDFNLADYTNRELLPILASRGCVNYCKFCSSWPFWRYRSRKADTILEEIKYLKSRYGVKKYDIIDASINGDIEQLDKLCDLLIKDKVEINWGGKICIRPEMTKEFLEKMYAAGCRWLSYGIESGSQRVLKDMGKNFDIRLAHEVLKNTHRLKMNVATFFIIGYPIETRKDFLETLWFIIKNRQYIGSISSGQKCGIPNNSILYRQASKYGIRFEKDGWYCGTNTPKEREFRHRVYKVITRLILLNTLHT